MNKAWLETVLHNTDPEPDLVPGATIDPGPDLVPGATIDQGPDLVPGAKTEGATETAVLGNIRTHALGLSLSHVARIIPQSPNAIY